MPTPSKIARVACGCSNRVETVEACREMLDDVAYSMQGDTDLAIVFFSREHVRRARVIMSAVLDTLAPGTMVGMSTAGVISNDHELDRQPGISIFAMSCPDVEFRTFTDDQINWPETQNDPARLTEVIGADQPGLRGIMALADPHTPFTRMLSSMSSAVAPASMDSPSIPFFGGVAAAGPQPGANQLLCNEEIRIGGLVGLSIRGAIRIDTLVSQGCRPIGKPSVITGAKRNIIESLGGGSALDAVRAVARSLPEHERALMQQGLFVGRVINEYRDRFGRGDFLIRNVVGVDAERGIIAVNDLVRVGQTIQFHVRDARTATEDLELLLSAQHLDDTPMGGLLFSCSGRGLNMFDDAHHDAGTIRRILSGMPLSGCFTTGEIGQVGTHSFIHGQTASLALFRLAD